MRHRSKIGMARAAGLGALTACGLLLNLVGPVLGQDRVGNAGDTTREARPATAPGPRDSRLATTPGTRVYAGVGQDTQLLIAHGLEMAIEGSTLQALATHPALATGGSAVGAPRGSRTATAPATVPVPVTDASGRVVTVAPAGVVTGRPVTPAPEVGARPAVVVPMNAAMLRQQAQQSFDGSDRLLTQAARDGSVDQRLRQAAAQYAATLKTLGLSPLNTVPPGAVGNGTGGSGTFPSATSATGVGGTGNPLTGPGGVAVATGAAPPVPAVVGLVAPAGGMTDAELASVAAINHAVKEAIGAFRIKQMVRVLGSADSPSAQVLMNHAREMDAKGLATVQLIAGVGGPAAAGPVQALAQQANDVILALQGIGGEARVP